MFCVIASDARAGSAASVAEALGGDVGEESAGLAALFATTPGDEDALLDAESSAPQPFSANVASATNSAFHRAFKKWTGESPGRYRARFQGKTFCRRQIS